ncbi:MAG: orotidine-5'-phosphate decarboxylase, partial [Candidatus Atribacteria bacterium]|nr:orotidine-5'-phosphate decarboxylase [Candidatus Atribacteria bacterium]
RTSNPGAPFVQDAFNPEKVYIMVARMVARLGKNMIGNFGFSSAGIVVGATYPEDLQFLREQFPSLLFLVPGIGFQQGKLEGLRPAFRSDGLGVVVNVSRDVLFAYRDGGDPSGFECEKEIRKKAILYQNKLNDLLR